MPPIYGNSQFFLHYQCADISALLDHATLSLSLSHPHNVTSLFFCCPDIELHGNNTMALPFHVTRKTKAAFHKATLSRSRRVLKNATRQKREEGCGCSLGQGKYNDAAILFSQRYENVYETEFPFLNSCIPRYLWFGIAASKENPSFCVAPSALFIREVR